MKSRLPPAILKNHVSKTYVTMKLIIIVIMCMFCACMAYAKPQCHGFNNYNDKVTIVFTDDVADKTYSVSDAKLVIYGKEYAATSIESNVKNGVATVTLIFPHITRFSNPKVILRINGKKAKFKVCQ